MGALRIYPGLPQPCLYHDSSYKGMKSHFCPISTLRTNAFPRDSRWFCSLSLCLCLHYW